MQKLALCIGINDYPGTGMDLAGCVNDAHDWSAELERRGFQVRRLLDAEATKAAMVQAIGALVVALDDGDLGVVTFSGHGTYELDADGDELRGFDQALCPYDIETADEALVDDELSKLFARRKPGARLVLISDSCHSGSVDRQVGSVAAGLPRKRFLPMDRWMSAPRRALAAKAKPGMRTGGVLAQRGRGADLLMSGCEDGDTDFSYDALIQGQPHGAFTFYALNALSTLPGTASYDAWHAEIVANLPTVQYPQQPQISGSPESRQRAALT